MVSVLARVRNAGWEKNKLENVFKGRGSLIYRIHGKKKYMDKLDKPIQGGEMVKLAFQKRREDFINLMATIRNNRKCNQKDKSDDKQQ